MAAQQARQTGSEQLAVGSKVEVVDLTASPQCATGAETDDLEAGTVDAPAKRSHDELTNGEQRAGHIVQNSCDCSLPANACWQ